jgi:hypothetical protein
MKLIKYHEIGEFEVISRDPLSYLHSRLNP